MTNRGRIIILLLTSAAGLSPFSIAVVCLASNEPMENYRDLIQHAAVVDEDGRHTEEEYAQKRPYR